MSKGIALSVSASVLFAVMYYYTSLLTPLNGVEIFGWRMLLTAPCMTLFILISGEWKRAVEIVRRVAANPKLIACLVVLPASAEVFTYVDAQGNRVFTEGRDKRRGIRV